MFIVCEECWPCGLAVAEAPVAPAQYFFAEEPLHDVLCLGESSQPQGWCRFGKSRVVSDRRSFVAGNMGRRKREAEMFFEKYFGAGETAVTITCGDNLSPRCMVVSMLPRNSRL